VVRPGLTGKGALTAESAIGEWCRSRPRRLCRADEPSERESGEAAGAGYQLSWLGRASTSKDQAERGWVVM
jgi:hypothetical protein